MNSLPIRRRTLGAFAACGLLPGLAASARAQQGQPYPAKTIVVRVGLPAGGPADASIRAAQGVLQRQLGQSVVIENQPGANGSIAAAAVLSQPADGYTLLGGTGADFLAAPQLIAAAKYRPLEFRLVGIVGVSDFLLVSSPAHQFGSAAELLDFARKPGRPEMSLAHWGPGSNPHIVGADFQARTGARFLEVPYKGAAPILADLGGGQIDLSFVPLGGPTLGLIRNGKLKPIALAADRRNPALPEVPTIAESLPALRGFDWSVWSAVWAPPRTPDAVVATLTQAFNDWLVSPENQVRIAGNASRRTEPASPADNAAFMRAEYEKYSRMVTSLKLSAQ